MNDMINVVHMIDIDGRKVQAGVEVEIIHIGGEGIIIRVNVDGICLFRMQRLNPELFGLTDERTL